MLHILRKLAGIQYIYHLSYMLIIPGVIVFNMGPNCHNGYTYNGYQWHMNNKHQAAQSKKPAEFGD